MALDDKVTHIRQQWDRLRQAACKPSSCIRCGRGDRLCWDGQPKRSVSVALDGEVVHVSDVRFRRILCKACKTRWAWRPPGMIPRKHFQPCVVARATSRYLFDEHASQEKVAAEHGCSRRTVGRWLRWVSALAEPAVLAARVVATADTVVLPRLRPVAAVARRASTQARRITLERAAAVLQWLEALGAAWGLEPPGLRAVLERVLNGRSDLATYRSPAIPDLARCTVT